MSEWTIASRLRRIGVCIALPIAFAGVSAQAADAMTFPTPTNATQLFNDVTQANSTPGFNVIPLGDFLYLPSSTQSMVITGNLEITGPPQLQPSQFVPVGSAPQINAQNQVASVQPLFTIASGANVILKAFDLTTGGGTAFPAITNSGNLEVDNMALAGNIGNALNVAAGNVTLNNASILNNNGGNTGSAALSNLGTGGTLTLNNTTVSANVKAGIEGPWVGHNSVFGGNGPACNTPAVSDVGSEDDDFSCGVTNGGGAPALGPAQFNGGPTLSAAPGAASDARTTGTTSWCERSDGRFFTNTGTTCSIGAFQVNATHQADTAGPTCHVDFIHNSTNPTVASMMQVSATDPDVAGLGADAIGNTLIVLKSNPSVTNGTVGFPTVPGTLFDMTSPGLNITDQPSSSPFPVTASKPVGDVTAGDTHWSFTATDWLNNVTLCQ